MSPRTCTPPLVAILLLVSLAVPTHSKTIMAFKRKLDTCDAEQDFVIPQTGSTKMIYAYNNRDPASTDEADLNKHDARGSHSVNLNSPAETVVLESDVANVTLVPGDVYVDGSQSTLYWCQAFSLPKDKRRHLVKFEPHYDEANRANLHHILVYACDGMSEDDLKAKGDCTRPNMPQSHQVCNFAKPISAWAIGGREFVLPPEAGIPMGEDGVHTVLMEVHYDNPNGRSFTDNSGMVFHYTEQLREHDAGIMFSGAAVDGNMAIPPNETAYELDGYCDSSCLANLPSEGLNIFATMLHMHLAGRAVRLQHFRGSKELPLIDENKYYDFNYQDVVNMRPYRKLMPGDTLRATCVYNTEGRTSITYGGLSTTSEMCLTYMWYYPLHPDAAQCVTSHDPEYGYYAGCANGNTVGKHPYQPPTITEPLNTTTECDVHGHVPVPVAEPRLLSVDEFDQSVYTHHEAMSTSGDVQLHWTLDTDNEVLDMAIEADTDGWVGVGFSPTGGMEGADIALGWAHDGGAIVKDRFAEGKRRPTVDTLQDLYDVRVYADGDLSHRYDVRRALSSDGDVKLYWTVDAAAQTVSFAIEGKTSGYVALGFSSSGSMIDAYAVIGMVDTSTGTPLVSVAEYMLKDKSTSAVRSGAMGTPNIQRVSGHESNGWTVIEFTLPMRGTKKHIDPEKTVGVIWALGEADRLAKHKRRGAAKVDLLTGDVSITDLAAKHRAHGVLMFLAFGVLAPIGVLVARFGKGWIGAPKWFHLHRGFMGLSMILMISGYVVAYDMVNGHHMREDHTKAGLTFLCIAWAQVLNAFIRPPKDARSRLLWEYFHKYLGRFAIAGACVNMFSGLHLANAGGTIKALLVLWFIALGLFFIVQEYFADLRERSEVSYTKMDLVNETQADVYDSDANYEQLKDA